MGLPTNGMSVREGPTSTSAFSGHDTASSQSAGGGGGNQTGTVSIIARRRGLRQQGPPIGRSADFPQSVVCFIKMHSDAASK